VKNFLPLSAAIAVVCTVFFSACYTVQQGVIMLGYLRRAVPLEDMAADDGQRFVERIADIRRFAVDELFLKDTQNYTRYVELDRDYLAAVVSASAKDSFTTYEWWFPVVGHVPYKGFFDEEKARAEAAKLKQKDLDVLIRRVDAFSTLGYFRDPLYSYMKNYSTYRLADLIIHETLHATVFIKGQSSFNEELAEFVGEEGSRLYIEKRFGKESPEYREMLEDRADSAAFVAFIQALIAELETLYTSAASREEKLMGKGLIIKEAQERFTIRYETLFTSDRYRFFSTMAVNNAYLELFRLYYAGDSYLRELYQRCGGERSEGALAAFISVAKGIKDKKDPKAALQLPASGGSGRL
jgi:predicted aminopeptidase